MRMARYILKDLLNPGEIVRQVCIQPCCLFLRLLHLSGIGPDSAALHQSHAVQRIHRLIRHHSDRLFDALEILVQVILRILDDHPHHLDRLMIDFLHDRRVTDRKDRQHDRKNHGNSDECYLKSDGMYLHLKLLKKREDAAPISFCDRHFPVFIFH